MMFFKLTESERVSHNPPKWFLDALNTSCPDIINLFNNDISTKNKNLFLNFISSISDLGIVGFGCRYFDHKGGTKLFTLSKDWNEIKKDPEFLFCLKRYLVKELLYVSKSKLKLVMRSGDKIDDKYLKYLSYTPINNGVVFYRFRTERIEVFYFVCSDTMVRDVVISNMSHIDALLNTANSSINWIMESNFISDKTIQILTKEQLKLVFSCPKFGRQNIMLKFNGDIVSLSLCEIECLSYLKHGLTIPYIAKAIGRSPLTIRDRVESLKEKLKVKSKRDLISLANTELLYLTNRFEIKTNNL